jgi:acetate kinase
VRVLVLNCGSSSVKYQVLDPDAGGEPDRRGLVERIGESGGPADHTAALREVLAELESAGLVPGAVGHRVVHGGERFTAPTVIDDEVVAGIEAQVPLAPLHNPANLAGIAAARLAFPDVPHVGVFDTAFHATLPAAAHRYAVPESWYRDHGVRRYGFHGTSHGYVARRAAELLGRPADAAALVTLHLGNGASAAAVLDGRSVDTSMGLGPLAGLVMGTRSGDVDPTVVFHVARQSGRSLDEVEHELNRESGLRGLAGDNDLRAVEAAATAGEPRASLALDVMIHRLVAYVGAYATGMGRLDGIVFTGGIGENSALVRRRVSERLGLLGVELDGAANEDVVPDAVVSRGDGPAVLVVATDEEREIARQTVAALAG